MAIDFKKKLTGGGSSQIDFVKRLNGLKLEEKPQQPIAEDRNSNFHPWQSFKEGFTSYKGEERSFKSAFIDGDPVKEGGKMWTDSVVNLADRISKAVETPNTSWADYAADTGSVLLGGVNVALAPIMGAMKGAENIPVLGAAATLTNKLAAGLFGVGGNSAVSALRVAPFLSDETKAKLEPVVEELGGLVATIVGFKYAGKYGGKVKAKYIDPRTAKIQTKIQEVSRMIGEDPKLKAEIGKFVTEHGPVRTLPVTSETPGSTQIPASPNQKHGAYAKSQGYEPITPDSQLPVISIGDKAPSKELPVIDAVTGEVRPGAGTDVGQYQMSLNEAPKQKTSTLLEESRTAPKEEKTTKTEEVKIDEAKPKEEAPYLSEEYNNMLIEMELSEKGYRYQKGDHDATVSESQWQGVPSTFPDWVPPELRLRSLFDKYLKDRNGTTDDLNIKYKEGSRLDRLHQAFIENLRQKEKYSEELRETQRLEQEAANQPVKEDTSAAEAEYLKMQGEALASEPLGAGKPELMRPVTGTGEIRNPKLSERVVENLSGQVQEAYKNSPLPTHRQANFSEIAGKVIEVFDTRPEYAMDVAMGREILPSGSEMTNTAFWIEAVNRATTKGDVQTLIDLSRSRVTEFATAAGQEIAYLKNLGDGDAVTLIKGIEDFLKSDAESKTKKSSDIKIQEEAQKIEEFIKKSSLPKEKWIALIKDIKTC